MQTPDATEVLRAANQMASGKAPRPDGLPSELFKAGGPEIINKLVTLYSNIWSKRSVPQKFGPGTLTTPLLGLSPAYVVMHGRKMMASVHGRCRADRGGPRDITSIMVWINRK